MSNTKFGKSLPFEKIENDENIKIVKGDKGLNPVIKRITTPPKDDNFIEPIRPKIEKFEKLEK